MIEALDIHVKGIVQGVGFRPFVYRQAKKYLINGWVLNAADGVYIHAEGEGTLLDEFVIELADNAPAAAQVDEIDIKEVPLRDCTSFEIRFSDQAEVQETTLVSPDLATCDDCVAELFNPANRRYRYPFINCTNCGPRFTIIDHLPYDRAATSMSTFEMCPACAHEYADPLDRRFHAQPDACFECGPVVSLMLTGQNAGKDELPPVLQGTTRKESDKIFALAVNMLVAGEILAVKGLGGFHLVCDANNPQAVSRLRERKHRNGKALAVMAASAEDAAALCEVSQEEQAVLTSAARPIVLLRRRADAPELPGIADGLSEIGVMTPYTPVQHLLLHDFAQAWVAANPNGAAEGRVPLLVMTSGNLHDEPICISNEEAVAKLSSVADGILDNNRPILTRFDDSVVRVLRVGDQDTAVQFIRRARGYAPVPLSIAAAEEQPDQAPAVAEAPEVLFATGPEQKNTCTLLRGTDAFVSQHIGDVENADVYDAWLAAKNRFERLFDAQPQAVACDLHPEYLTTKWAMNQPLPVTTVQHHHAHIAAVLGEHQLDQAVCGIAFDGTGYGADGRIWGGEVLLANRQTYERFANFAYVPMPGGAAAVKNPLRMAYGVLWAYDLLEHPAVPAALLEPLGEEAGVCETMIERGINTPMTSSVGRLFDAASALLGVCPHPTYEGEGAIKLEAVMELAGADASHAAVVEEAAGVSGEDELVAHERYAITVVKNTATETSTALDTSVVLLDAENTFRALLDDLQAGVAVPVIARRFHDAFASAVIMAAELVRAMYGISTVVLSGGCFMNRYLMEHCLPELSAAGFTVAINRDLPPNDGCVSFGQAVVAWAQNNQVAAGDSGAVSAADTKEA